MAITFEERTGTANPLDSVFALEASPTFADIDEDGDLDAFIGAKSGIQYYQNDGSGNFSQVTGSGNPLDSVSTGSSAPTFADIDGDGDLDAFIGNYDGDIKYFENDGSGNLSEVTGSGNPFDGVDVGYYSAPTFADIDEDGDLDAFIGEDGGNINYFENDGSGNFSEVTGSGNPFDGVDVGNYSAPTFADIDGDGDLDAFIGEGDGTIKYFENDGFGNFSEVTGSGNPFDGVDVGNGSSKPTFADIDGDGDLDAFIGELVSGTIKYFENVTPPPGQVITGTNQKDTLTGGAGDDTISGGNSADELYGGAGDDILGGDGNDNGPDILNGGVGNDTLTGGNGPDIFVLAEGEGTDTITDWETADSIGLSGGIGFSDLEFSGSDIILTSTSEVLATLTGVDTTTLTSSDFTTV